MVPFVTSKDEGYEALNYNDGGGNFDRMDSAPNDLILKMGDPTMVGGVYTSVGTPK